MRGHLAPDGGPLNHCDVRAGEGRGDGVAETSPARAHFHVQRARPWVNEPPGEVGRSGGVAFVVWRFVRKNKNDASGVRSEFPRNLDFASCVCILW